MWSEWGRVRRYECSAFGKVVQREVEESELVGQVAGHQLPELLQFARRRVGGDVHDAQLVRQDRSSHLRVGWATEHL